MSLNLKTDQLKGLINHAKNEVLDEERAKDALAEALHNSFNNDLGLHRVMMMSLTAANQVQMLPPVLGTMPPSMHSDTLGMTFSAADPFTNKVLEKLKKQALYFACFADQPSNFPQLVVDRARDILKVETQTILFNDLDLRLANLGILMELMARDTVNYGEGNTTIVAEKALNGNQPYTKVTLKYFNPSYAGNNFEIVKTVYSYDLIYTYLSMTVKNNTSFGNNNGHQVTQLPAGMIPVLDNCIMALYKEYNDKRFENDENVDYLSPKQMVAYLVENIGVDLHSIYTACMSKFVPEDELTHAQKMQSITHFIREYMHYTNRVTILGHQVFEMSQYYVDVSEDNELLLFTPQVFTFTEAGETHEKQKVTFEFNHLGVSNVNELVENENDNVLIFTIWILNIIHQQFRTIQSSAENLTVLKMYGRTY